MCAESYLLGFGCINTLLLVSNKKQTNSASHIWVREAPVENVRCTWLNSCHQINRAEWSNTVFYGNNATTGWETGCFSSFTSRICSFSVRDDCVSPITPSFVLLFTQIKETFCFKIRAAFFLLSLWNNNRATKGSEVRRGTRLSWNNGILFFFIYKWWLMGIYAKEEHVTR